MPISELDARARAACLRGDVDSATTAALGRYQREIRTYLATELRSDDAVDEAYSRFAIALWRSLHTFRWESSLRSWCYAVARSAAQMQRRCESRRREEPMPTELLDQHEGSSDRTVDDDERDAKLQRILASTSVEDRTLLILRITQHLSWQQAAVEMGGRADPSRTAAKLRKRYQRIQRKLRRLLRRSGREIATADRAREPVHRQ